MVIISSIHSVGMHVCADGGANSLYDNLLPDSRERSVSHSDDDFLT